MAIGVYLQGIVTELDYRLVGRLTLISRRSSEDSVEPLETSVAELTIQSNTLSIGLNIGYQVPMFALAGIAWLMFLWRGYDHPVTRFIFALVALGTGLSVASYAGVVSFNPIRPLLLIIPLLAILIAFTVIFLATTSSLPVSHVRIGLAIVLLLVLLGGQVISLQASSDSTLQERNSLNEPELTAKIWGDIP